MPLKVHIYLADCRDGTCLAHIFITPTLFSKLRYARVKFKEMFKYIYI